MHAGARLNNECHLSYTPTCHPPLLLVPSVSNQRWKNGYTSRKTAEILSRRRKKIIRICMRGNVVFTCTSPPNAPSLFTLLYLESSSFPRLRWQKSASHWAHGKQQNSKMFESRCAPSTERFEKFIHWKIAVHQLLWFIYVPLTLLSTMHSDNFLLFRLIG